MILVIDNYDSFVFNLARYFRLLGCETNVVRNDQLTGDQIEFMVGSGQVQAIVMSPGPCTPDQAGVCLEITKRLAHRVPMLGVCLGHQVIAQALGGKVIQWKQPIHGKADYVYHDQQHEYLEIENPFRAGRYHSLTVLEKSLPPFLEVSARLEDQTVMGIRHRQWPLIGFQFHPESILTGPGIQLIQRFLKIAGIEYRTTADTIQRRCELPLGSFRSQQPSKAEGLQAFPLEMAKQDPPK